MTRAHREPESTEREEAHAVTYELSDGLRYYGARTWVLRHPGGAVELRPVRLPAKGVLYHRRIPGAPPFDGFADDRVPCAFTPEGVCRLTSGPLTPEQVAAYKSADPDRIRPMMIDLLGAQA